MSSLLPAEDAGVLVGVPVQQLLSVLAEVDPEAADRAMRTAAHPRRLEGRRAAGAGHRYRGGERRGGPGRAPSRTPSVGAALPLGDRSEEAAVGLASLVYTLALLKEDSDLCKRREKQ